MAGGFVNPKCWLPVIVRSSIVKICVLASLAAFAIVGPASAADILHPNDPTAPLPPDAGRGECWCYVTVPAVYKTVQESVITKEASTRAIEVPAEYQTVSKRVLVTPEREDRIPVPAVYETVSRKELVTPEIVEWVRIECASGKAPAETGWYSYPR